MSLEHHRTNTPQTSSHKISHKTLKVEKRYSQMNHINQHKHFSTTFPPLDIKNENLFYFRRMNAGNKNNLKFKKNQDIN